MSDDDWSDNDDDYSEEGKSSGGGGLGGLALLIFGVGALVGFVVTKMFSGSNRNPPHSSRPNPPRPNSTTNPPRFNGTHQPQPGTSGTQYPSTLASETSRIEEEEHIKRRVAGRKLEAELDKAPDLVKCIVCFNNEREVVLFPCRHTCICVDCSNRLKCCPYCNRTISDKKVTYIP